MICEFYPSIHQTIVEQERQEDRKQLFSYVQFYYKNKVLPLLIHEHNLLVYTDSQASKHVVRDLSIVFGCKIFF